MDEMNMIIQKSITPARACDKHLTADMSHVKNGFVTLISMIVIGALSVTVGVSLLLLGLGASRTSFALEQSSQAKSLANTCAEKALGSLRADLNYAGNESLSLAGGSCSILPVGGAGNANRTVQTTGTMDTVTRKILVQITQIQPQIQLQSWQEVADF